MHPLFHQATLMNHISRSFVLRNPPSCAFSFFLSPTAPDPLPGRREPTQTPTNTTIPLIHKTPPLRIISFVACNENTQEENAVVQYATRSPGTRNPHLAHSTTSRAQSTSASVEGRILPKPVSMLLSVIHTAA